jgi:hypothetical protein
VRYDGYNVFFKGDRDEGTFFSIYVQSLHHDIDVQNESDYFNILWNINMELFLSLYHVVCPLQV